MTNLAWLLVSIATGPTPAVVQPKPVEQKVIVVKAPSIPVGQNKWFHPAPGVK